MSINYNKKDLVDKFQLDLELNGDYHLEIKLNSNDNFSNKYSNCQINNNNNNKIKESNIARKIFKNLSKLKSNKPSKLNESDAFYNKIIENETKLKYSSKNDDFVGRSSTKKGKSKANDESKHNNKWSIHDAFKIFNNDDSENEEIPLVFRDKKNANISNQSF